MSYSSDTSEISYQETLVSYAIIAVIVLLELILVIIFIADIPVVATLSLITPVIFLLLFKLNVKVEAKRLVLSYGIGLIYQSYSPSEIGSMHVVENKSLISWIYNPMGSHALLLRFRSGQQKVIPVNNPKKIIELLR